MFFDEVVLELEGGQGGNGMLSFHKEKFIAHGPPDGGDGGNGGAVIVEADSNYNTFRHFSGKKTFKGERGQGGHKNNRAGRTGENVIIKVPIGTLVSNADSGEKLVDLTRHGQSFVAAKGGRGGFGNGHFASSTRQAPRFAELGDIGAQITIKLELQLIADVGLLGFPSAGKSTLISHVSSAKPKVGDYPFTTIVPNLGVVNLSQFGGSESQSFVIADMPGIIEGASEGKGLGDTFLKHISRSATLVYLLDPFSYEGREVVEQYEVLRSELEKFNSELLKKESVIVINKIDAIPPEDRAEIKSNLEKSHPELKDKIFLISGVSGENLDDLLFALWNMIQKAESDENTYISDEANEVNEELEYTPIHFVDDQSFQIEKMYEVDVYEFEPPIVNQIIKDESKPKRQLYSVHGDRIEQISRMTNTDQPDGVQRVYDVMKKMNIHPALIREGAVSGDLIKIGPHVFEFHDLKKE